jgi:Flp pilus assembly protein TadG
MTLLETAIVVSAFLGLVIGALDLGTAVFRWHVLSQAARQSVRQAIVHGQYAPSGWNGGPWTPASGGYPGSTPYTVTASNSTDTIAGVVRQYLTGVDPSQVTVKVEWVDGNPPNNNVESRVRVTLSTTWQPMMAFPFGSPSVPLSASSMMPIAH